MNHQPLNDANIGTILREVNDPRLSGGEQTRARVVLINNRERVQEFIDNKTETQQHKQAEFYQEQWILCQEESGRHGYDLRNERLTTKWYKPKGNNKNSFALDTPNYWVKMGTRALIIGGLVGILYIGYQISNYSYKMIDNTISSPIMQQIENMNK
ncbi:MAG: hypothetical protein QF824_06145 [Candidatus Woesearchaeota archaeon]|jgi:hypothetical protein|nr:hypothetical protein [Candidatus Woesearchaeota archaeon]|tara:strand:+ start:779 stop:1246 length:468 start_codon:yes stop_codon:yes gene_type:complete